MEILRHFVANPPRRTLKFNWYGSEEMGLLGSKAWVKAHKDELKDHVYMINVDVGGSVLGADQALVLASKEAATYCDSFMRRKGYAVITKQDIYSSDGVPFADNGVPGMSFARIAPKGGALIHSRKDVMDFLSEDNYYKTCDFIALFASKMANSKVFPVEQEIPGNMKEEMEFYFGRKERPM